MLLILLLQQIPVMYALLLIEFCRMDNNPYILERLKTYKNFYIYANAFALLSDDHFVLCLSVFNWQLQLIQGLKDD